MSSKASVLSKASVIVSLLICGVALSACQTSAPYVVPGIAKAPPKRLFALPDFRSARTTARSSAYGAPVEPVRQSPSTFSLAQYASGDLSLDDVDYDVAALLETNTEVRSIDEIMLETAPDTKPNRSRVTESTGAPAAKPMATQPNREIVARIDVSTSDSSYDDITPDEAPTNLSAVFAGQPEMQPGNPSYAHALRCEGKLSLMIAMPPSGALSSGKRAEVLEKWRTCVATNAMGSLTNG